MDDDFALALLLQEEYNREARLQETKEEWPNTKCSLPDIESISLVDEQWEYMDPNPDVRALFLQFNDKFFWGKLDGVEVRWSPRMTLCAGLCCYEGRGGLCSVRLSQPLLKLRPRKDLIETLLHEMIHAYLFVTENNRDHDAHGPEFHKHMHRINKATGTNISVYHNFHDEVEHHRQHWWRCDGPCQKRPPYFGFVKRAMNRAPHPRDFWWADHQRTCGGTYTKVKEPETYGKKKEGSKTAAAGSSKQGSPEKSKGMQDIRDIFRKVGDKKAADVKASDVDSSANPLKVSGGGAKISGFSDFNKDKSLSPPNETPAHFPGRGFTLGSSSVSDNKQPDRIVRKLPGIGLVTTERHVGPQPLQLPSLPTSPTDTGSRKRPLEESEDSDSDTDEILARLKAKRRRSDLGLTGKRNSIGAGSINNVDLLNDSLSDASPGTSRRVPGFLSVSNKDATPREFISKDPAMLEHDRGWIVRKGGRRVSDTPLLPEAWNTGKRSNAVSGNGHNGNIINTGNHGANTSLPIIILSSSSETDEEEPVQKPVRKKSPPRNLAVGRNQRALLGNSSSDSDTDDMESFPLRTVQKTSPPRNLAVGRNQRALLGYGDSDSDTDDMESFPLRTVQKKSPRNSVIACNSHLLLQDDSNGSDTTDQKAFSFQSAERKSPLRGSAVAKTECAFDKNNDTDDTGLFPLKTVRMRNVDQSRVQSSSSSIHVRGNTSETSSGARISSADATDKHTTVPSGGSALVTDRWRESAVPPSTVVDDGHEQPGARREPLPGAEVDPLRQCPVCQVWVRESSINTHLDACLNM